MDVGIFPNHINSCIFCVFMCVCLLVIFVFTLCNHMSGIRVRLGFNPLVIIMMSSTKYEVENFWGKKIFSLWLRQMKDLLIQQRVHKALYLGR